METERNENVMCLFDGNYFYVTESNQPEVDAEEYMQYNLDLEIMGVGPTTNVSLYEIRIIFREFTLYDVEDGCWFLLNQENGQILIDLCEGDIQFNDMIGAQEYSHLNV